MPKSYWVWNHRRWVLEHIPVPAWNRELKLLNYMLEKDARNCSVLFMNCEELIKKNSSWMGLSTLCYQTNHDEK